MIDLVDFGPFLDGSSKQSVGEAIVRSFKDTGFVYLVNHGLPKDKIDSMFQWVGRAREILPSYQQITRCFQCL